MSRLTSRFDGPEHSPGLLLWQVTNSWQKAIRLALAPHELTHVQFVLLAVLVSQQPSPLTQSQLAEVAATDSMMTSQVVRTLEAKGMVERRRHPTDGRAFLLSPTSYGIQAVNAANIAVEEADTTFFGALGLEGVDKFVELLDCLRQSH